MKRFFLAVTAFTICGSVLIPSVAAHDIDGLDVTVWLSDPKLEEAVGTPFLKPFDQNKIQDKNFRGSLQKSDVLTS